MVKISVLMPVYNPQIDYLRQAIESILIQDFHDWELIIIDDCSHMNVKEIFDKILKDKKIILKYYRNDKNLGIWASLNKWIQLSSWKYIARLDQDDYWWNKNKLKRQFDFLEKNNEYAICWTDSIIIDDSWNIIWITHFKKDNDAIKNIFLVYNQFVHSSVLFNKNYVKSLWWYNTSYLLAQDYELWCRLWKYYKFANIRDVYTYYRENPWSLSMKKKKKQFYETLKIIISNYNYYPNSLKWILTQTFLFASPKRIIHFLVKIKSKLCR